MASAKRVKSQLVLGLDVGANSIGWALLNPGGATPIIAGVRVFPEGVENYDTRKETSKTESRRVARGMRRQIMRRAARKVALRRLLGMVDLAPDADGVDPYSLRRKGLDSPLTPGELGRVLVHLNQRRGFKSNRKTDRARKADDEGTLGEINWVGEQIKASGSRTLGEMMDKVLRGEWKSDDDESGKLQGAVRRVHTRREMFLDEFNQLWEKQKSFDSPLSKLLTDDLRLRLNNPIKDGDWMHKGLIFGQRNMYWSPDVIGYCELEPLLRRTERADRLAQRFRLLQEVNNIRYLDPETGGELPLNQEQRALLLDKLARVEKMDFDRMRKELGFLESISFNLERGKRKSIKGMPVDAALAHKDLFGKAWFERPESEKNEIVRDLIDLDDEVLKAKAVAEWRLSPESAEKLLSVELPEGHASLSRIALRKLLPAMERGLLYMTDDGTPCALTEAGYLRPDQRPHEQSDLLPEPLDIANPVVRQALHEVRRVVNAVVNEYGKPDRIHVELARDATKSAEERMKSSKIRQQNEDRRSGGAEAIREAVRDHGLAVRLSRDAIDRFLLWKEQGGDCIYSGNPIGIRQLLLGEADIDHILPYSKTLDDSMMNKVVAFRTENQAKGQRTPFEWLENQPDKLERVRQSARHLPYAKRIRFTQKQLELDSFVQRQLNDTRYIARAVKDYLRCLVVEPHYVVCPKGTHTAELRRHWGLNTVLRELPDSPAWAEDDQLRDGEKDRSDHRHHAIDAIVIALTGQERLQQLSQIARQGGTQATGEILPEPWPLFRKTVKDSVAAIKVSHRVQRRVSGALHEETLYGPVRDKLLDGTIKQRADTFVVRKSLEALTPAMVDDIRDSAIRSLVIARLKERNVAFGRKTAGGIPSGVWVPQLTMPSGTPVKKVRLLKKDETIRPIRRGTTYVKPGSMHHLCIFEWTEGGKKKRGPIFISTLDAVDRIKRRETIIQRKHPQRPDAQFIMSLSRGEIVLDVRGKGTGLFVFSTAASTQGQIYFYPLADARRASEKATFAVKANSMSRDARKVTVDPLGRIRWAND